VSVGGEEHVGQRQALLCRIAADLADASYERVEMRGYTVFHLSPSSGADYAFSVWVYEDAEPQITATLLSAPDKEMFWGRSFELPDYASTEARDAEFFTVLDRVLTYPTRITQTRSLLFWCFDCEAELAGSWVSVGGCSAVRWIRSVPPADGPQVEYSSGPIRRTAR